MLNAINELVRSSLPEFYDLSEVEISESARRLDLRRRRKDGTYERLFFTLSVNNGEQSLGLQIAVSYFLECPIPSGPFGYDAGIEDVLGGPLRDRLDKFSRFNGWYLLGFAARLNSLVLEYFKEALSVVVRPTLDKWAEELLADDLLRIAVGTYREIEENKDLDRAEDLLSRRLDRIGPTTAEGYPVSKIKRQLLQRLEGGRNWYML